MGFPHAGQSLQACQPVKKKTCKIELLERQHWYCSSGPNHKSVQFNRVTEVCFIITEIEESICLPVKFCEIWPLETGLS